MKWLRRAVVWCMVLAALTGLFWLRQACAGADGRTRLTLLTQEGARRLSMDRWLAGAVAAEMPTSFQPEALKAQAVAARTYALACTRHEGAGADVCTDAGCCVAWADEEALRTRWGGDYKANMAKIEAAVAATDGQYLTYGGAPIQAAFHASSLGCTEDSGALWSPLPYLVSVDTPETPEAVPALVTDVTVPDAELIKALGFNPGRDPSQWLGPVELDGAGRVQELTVCGKRYTGSQVRAALGLRSTAFTVLWEDGVFRFTVSGHGHGVGMSQYGAQIYALDGMGYRDILAHYYPGTELASYAP